MAVFAASEWKTKLGLEIETESMEFKVLLKKRHDGAFQIARNGWVADYNDATTFLTLVRCDSDQNDNRNCNRAAEALIEQGSQSTDVAKRKRNWVFRWRSNKRWRMYTLAKDRSIIF